MNNLLQYRLFGRGTGLRVSSIALGGALFGTAWGYGSEPDEVQKILLAYAEAGGNFIDTADSYQFGQSEELIGKFLHGRRDDFVLASKFTLGSSDQGRPLATGNSRKAMCKSLEASLRRLDTDYIDLYWVHMSDGTTSTEEILQGLNDLVCSGKVRYIGFSDFPAWRVARAATYAELRGWSRVIGLQFEYSLAERAGDRELLPMASALGLGITAWSPLGGGFLSGKYRRGEEGRATTFGHVVHRETDSTKTSILDAIIGIANEMNASPCQVALSWLMQKGIVPIIGPRTESQLHDNLGASNLSISQDNCTRLDAVSRITLGFPHDFLADEAQRVRVGGGVADRLIDAYGAIA